jgi:hypothetical protein
MLRNGSAVGAWRDIIARMRITVDRLLVLNAALEYVLHDSAGGR